MLPWPLFPQSIRSCHFPPQLECLGTLEHSSPSCASFFWVQNQSVSSEEQGAIYMVYQGGLARREDCLSYLEEGQTEASHKPAPCSSGDSILLTCSGIDMAGARPLMGPTVSCHGDFGAGHWVLEGFQVRAGKALLWQCLGSSWATCWR